MVGEIIELGLSSEDGEDGEVGDVDEICEYGKSVDMVRLMKLA